MGRKSIRRAFIISIGTHVLVLLLVVLLTRDSLHQKLETAPLWVELEPLSPPKKEKQIAASQTGEITKDAPEDAFLGPENRRVKKQTVALQPRPPDKPGRPPSPKRPAAVPSANAPWGKKPAPLAALGVPLWNMGASKKREDRPEFVDPSRDTGQIRADYVRGIKEGEVSALNTKEYIFFSYFERIRERLDRAWVSSLKEQLLEIRKKGRHLASDIDHITRTIVVLNTIGQIVQVRVIEESGTHDLDVAAVKAFNQAGPFPNPPRGLVDDQGRVEIRWDFILKT